MSWKKRDNTFSFQLSLKVIDGIMGIKESEWKLPAVDYRLLESKRRVMSMRGIRGLSDQELDIITLDLWEGKERQHEH